MFTGDEPLPLIRAIRVLAVDPLGDYRRLTDELGGTHVELGASGVGSNPFAMTGAATDASLTAKIASVTCPGCDGRWRYPPPDRRLDRALRDTSRGGHRTGSGDTLTAQVKLTLADLWDQLAQTAVGAPLAHRVETHGHRIPGPALCRRG